MEYGDNMSKSKKEKKKPERNWISISAIMIIVAAFLTFYYPSQLRDIFFFLYFLILWFLIFVYVLGNTLREVPDFGLRKSLLKIKKIEVYESWYFLMVLGMVFLSIVIVASLRFGREWGITLFGFLFGFLGLWIRDILLDKRGKRS